MEKLIVARNIHKKLGDVNVLKNIALEINSSGIFGGLEMDVIYNIGDAINKIGFGLVVYNLAVNSKA